ncbi:MAG: GHKL domain-containing protein [Clostridia bacterium]
MSIWERFTSAYPIHTMGRSRKKEKCYPTTKENKDQHGIGLNNVRKVVEKYDGEMDCHHTDDIFTVEILLYL